MKLSKNEGVKDLWWPYGPSVGRYTIKATGQESDGSLVQLLIRDSRGAATPLHIHHETDETLYLIDGEITAVLGDERIEAKAGDYLFLPRGVPHAWVVTSERTEMFVTCGPAGKGLDGFFAEVAVPVNGGEPPQPTMPDNAHFAERMLAHGIELVGPPPTVA